MKIGALAGAMALFLVLMSSGARASEDLESEISEFEEVPPQASSSYLSGFSRELKRKRRPGASTEPMMCAPTRPCKRLGGRCLDKETCLSNGAEFRWIGEKRFCKRNPKVPMDPEKPCGCCFKSEQPNGDTGNGGSDQSEPSTIVAGTSSNVEFEARGILFATVGDSTTNIIGEGKARPRAGFQIDRRGIRRVTLVHLGGWEFKSFGSEYSKISCSGTSCKAEVAGHASSNIVDKFIPQTEVEKGVFVSAPVPAIATLEFEIPSTSELDSLMSETEKLNSLHVKDGSLKGYLSVKPTDEQMKAGLKRFDLAISMVSRLQYAKVIVDWAKFDPTDVIIIDPFPIQEEKLNLCIQPIRIRHRTCEFSFLGICFWYSYTYSGDGLAFGQPQAAEQWGKVDISFTYKDWITINDNSGKYKSVTTSETGSLRAEVANDPDCVEVFFIPKWSPSDTYGGGATWSSGTSNAQIITSDEMVSCGVDITHLAHELGHALMDPSVDHHGQTGTLMCPSGWERDNPRRNSKANGQNANNPLLICSFSIYTFDTHDCTDNSDCGTCDAHYPADSC